MGGGRAHQSAIRNPQSAVSYLTTRCEYWRKYSTTSSNSSPGETTGNAAVQRPVPATGSATKVLAEAPLKRTAGIMNSTVLLVATSPKRFHIPPRPRQVLTSDQRRVGDGHPAGR